MNVRAATQKAEDTTISHGDHILWYSRYSGWSLLDGVSGETFDRFGSERPSDTLVNNSIASYAAISD